MVPGDLTTLGNVKAWMATSNYASTGIGVDPLLMQLITRESSIIRSILNRDWILPKDYTDVISGEGQTAMYTKNWPVNSVASLMIGSQAYQPADALTPGSRTEGSSGYRLEPWDGIPPGGAQSIGLACMNRFPKGYMNIQLQYNAGYLAPMEPWTIPPLANPGTDTTSTIMVLQLHGIWAMDVSVTRSDGTPMTRVLAPPTDVGQYYIIPPDSIVAAPSVQPANGANGGVPQLSPLPGIASGSLALPGQYVFFQGDVGSQVQISYGYIPAALEQVTIEMILERYVYRTRVGEISRTVAQQVTARYDFAQIPAYAKPTLQAYSNILLT